MLELTEYAKIFIGLLAVLNPLGAVPLYIAMTTGQTAVQKKRTSDQVALGVGTILVLSLIFGEVLLYIFGISINSFRVGGGILVLLMAISMLQAKTSPIKQTDEEAHESIEKTSVAIVPLAMPLLAGPGAIGTAILAANKSSGVTHYACLIAGVIVLSGAIWAILRLSPIVESRISATGINIFTRIMGLILSAIAIEFIANGLKGLFPSLA